MSRYNIYVGSTGDPTDRIKFSVVGLCNNSPKEFYNKNLYLSSRNFAAESHK